MPSALGLEHGKYLVIEKVYFAYGHEIIVSAIESNQKRQKLQREKDPSFTSYGQAISYRFKQGDHGQWYVFASTSREAPSQCTQITRGAIGLDLNIDHIALVETDAHGNKVHVQSLPLNTYGKSKQQTEALIGDVAAQIVRQAAAVRKPVVLENLDFKKKKETLKEQSSRSYARTLSSFAYNKIISMVQSRGYRAGVEVLSVNPAFTSVIGRTKYALRYGLSIHQSAALCIARRGLGVFERVPSHLDRIPDGKGGHFALTLPERTRAKQKGAFWKLLSKELSAELVAHFRTMKKIDPSGRQKPPGEMRLSPLLTLPNQVRHANR